MRRTIRREYAIKAVSRLKQVETARIKLMELGVDLTDHQDSMVNVIEESIALIFAKNDAQYENILVHTQKWLNGELTGLLSIIGDDIDGSTVEGFVDWLESWYG